MAAPRSLDASKLQGMLNVSQGQEKSSGYSPTTDPDFPLMKTPVNKSIIVYIPRTNVVEVEPGVEKLEVLNSLIHDVNRGRYTEKHRCINGLQGFPEAEEIGYDGTCPFCEATTQVWELYNLQMEAKAKAKGFPSVEADTGDTLKDERRKVLDAREITNAEEYVTFNIVIIPSEDNVPTPTALEDMTPVFVQWRKKRYDDKLLKALTGMFTKPQHLGGLYMIWDFTYTVEKGKENARDSAQHATYSIIQDAQALQSLSQYTAQAELVSKEFTLIKATDVIIANKFLYREDIEKMAVQYTKKTVQMLEMSKAAQAGNNVQGLGMGMPQQQLTQGQNPIASFGLGAVSGQGQMGVNVDQGQQPMQMQQQPMQQMQQQQPDPQQQQMQQQQQQPDPQQQQQQMQQQGNPLFNQ